MLQLFEAAIYRGRAVLKCHNKYVSQSTRYGQSRGASIALVLLGNSPVWVGLPFLLNSRILLSYKKGGSMFNKLLAFVVISCLAVSGCASYRAGNLPSSDVGVFKNAQDQDGLKVAVRFLDARESKQVFGVGKVYGLYQPVYIAIDNRTKTAYQFGKRSSINMQSVPAEEVAKNCGFSTVGRATAYGVAGIFIWPLLIPAVVDGCGSAQANQKMESDYMYKEIRDDRIQPNGLLNGVVFVSKMKEGDEFVIRLQNVDTNEIKLFSFVK